MVDGKLWGLGSYGGWVAMGAGKLWGLGSYGGWEAMGAGKLWWLGSYGTCYLVFSNLTQLILLQADIFSSFKMHPRRS